MNNKIIAVLLAVLMGIGVVVAAAPAGASTPIPYNTWWTVDAGFSGRPCNVSIDLGHTTSGGTTTEQAYIRRSWAGCQSYPVNIYGGTYTDTEWVLQYNYKVCDGRTGVCGTPQYFTATLGYGNPNDLSTYATYFLSCDANFQYISSNIRVWRVTTPGSPATSGVPGGAGWVLVGTFLGPNG